MPLVGCIACAEDCAGDPLPDITLLPVRHLLRLEASIVQELMFSAPRDVLNQAVATIMSGEITDYVDDQTQLRLVGRG